MNIRVNRKSYTTLSNYPIIDRNLSAISLGIFTYIMSKPDGWKAHKNEIYKRFGDASITTSKNAIDQAFKELVNIGYVEIKTVMTTNDKGQKIFNGREYVFNEEPKTMSQNLPNSEDFGSSVISDIGNYPTSEILPHIVKTDFKENTDKEKTNTDLIERKKNYKSSKSTLIFPSEFSPQIIKIINDYFEYRKEIKKPFKSDKTYLTKIDQFKEQVKKYGEEIVIASINNAIANGWQGTFINDELLKQFTNNQNLVKDAKGNYADTQAGRQQFILDIREGATNRFIERGLLKKRD